MASRMGLPNVQLPSMPQMPQMPQMFRRDPAPPPQSRPTGPPDLSQPSPMPRRYSRTASQG